SQPRQPASPVLVVDDDELLLAYLAETLEEAGYEVETAQSGSQALQYLDARSECRLVIADWEMPDMDGPGLCRSIRERSGAPYTYVLLFTIRGTSADIVTGLQAGADDFLVKGSPVPELLARLNSGRRIVASAGSSGAQPLEESALSSQPTRKPHNEAVD